MDELEAISALRALGEPTRLRVMRLLVGAQDGMAAGDIAGDAQMALAVNAEYPAPAPQSKAYCKPTRSAGTSTTLPIASGIGVPVMI
jgi:hypothetical protein